MLHFQKTPSNIPPSHAYRPRYACCRTGATGVSLSFAFNSENFEVALQLLTTRIDSLKMWNLNFPRPPLDNSTADDSVGNLSLNDSHAMLVQLVFSWNRLGRVAACFSLTSFTCQSDWKQLALLLWNLIVTRCGQCSSHLTATETYHTDRVLHKQNQIKL